MKPLRLRTRDAPATRNARSIGGSTGPLGQLAGGEHDSIFCLTGSDSPHLRHAGPEVKRPLQEENEAGYSHADEFSALQRHVTICAERSVDSV